MEERHSDCSSADGIQGSPAVKSASLIPMRWNLYLEKHKQDERFQS